MRLPKDAFYAHQVMWDGWVSPEHERTYIVGHWNYGLTPSPSPKERGAYSYARENSNSGGNYSPLVGREAGGEVKPVYAVSTADSVELFVNGKSQGFGRRSFEWLFTWDSVHYESGTLEAIGYKNVKGDLNAQSLNLNSQFKIETAGEPYQLHLTAIENPEGMKADGADVALIQFEVLDREGRRCPLDNRLVHFQLWGEGQWIGGIGTRDNAQCSVPDVRTGKDGLLDSSNTKNLSDNYVGHLSLPVECGVNRVLVRSTTTAGHIFLSAYADGIRPAYVKLTTQHNDFSMLPALTLPCHLDRGETPATPSYQPSLVSVEIVDATAGSNIATLSNSYDDNELSEWHSDGERNNAWVTYRLSRPAAISELTLKLSGWRQKCYPLEVYAGRQKVWEGVTPATLGYAHISVPKPVVARELTIRMVAPVQDSQKFGQVKELSGTVANELDRARSEKGRIELRIVEVDFAEAAK